MNTDGSEPRGWRESLRRTADSVLGLIHTRLELLGVELQEEKLRAVAILVWIGIGLGLAFAGFLVGLAALALFLWTRAGYAGLIGLALVALAAGAGVLWRLRRSLQQGPTPFNQTVEEFRKDREWLRNHR